LNEADAEVFAAALAASPTRHISAVSALEAAIVIETRKGPEGVAVLDELLAAAQFEIVALDESQYRLAREAYSRFGKGRHPAGLNFGDCCAYALARQRNEPLLFKGNDFGKTDIAVAALSPAH
jgi:Uncharacterized protein conserved in bacteria